MNRKQRILYVVDFLPNVPNSVGDILNCMLKFRKDQYDQYICLGEGRLYNIIDHKRIKGYSVYSAEEKNKKELILSRKYSVHEKMLYLVRHGILNLLGDLYDWDGYNKDSEIKYFQQILKMCKPDLVIFFMYTPKRIYIDACIKNRIPYMHMLYDTVISRPRVANNCLADERYCIEHAKGYFIPSFFFHDYQKKYKESTNVFSYDLPLLISSEMVKRAYSKNTIKKYKFSYFGQIQKFRKAEQIKMILRKAGIVLNVFTTMKLDSDDAFNIHEAVSGGKLFDTIVMSEFLIAFDNGVPYENYLPSKAYLYVSFTKPVIAFGDNKSSALIDFFKDYPMFYYQNINEPLDGLYEFIETNSDNGFRPKIYNKYMRFLPQNSLTGVFEVIENGI